MTTTSQPISPPVIVLEPPPQGGAFTGNAVDILSPPPNATDIVDAGQPVVFRINLRITGFPGVVGMYASEPVQVKIHCEQIEKTIPPFTLGPFTFTTPATVPALNAGFSFTTPSFTTSLNTGGGTFKTATGDDDGVYRVTTELHFADPSTHSNCMIDDRILVVTQTP